MGVVYRALDLVSGDVVALKLLHASELPNAHRFAREAELLARLECDAIVGYVAHGLTPEGQHYLAMEWLEGVDLGSRLRALAVRGEALALDEVLRLGERVADALSRAHAVGVVHRDVKPANVFLERGELERARLLDFGVARVTDESLTATGATFGTPAYMAPEQARGDKRVDARADLFSLGCVLYECVALRPPFVGEHAMAVLAKVLLEEPPPLASAAPTTPRAFEQLVARLLAKSPDARPATAREVARELRLLREALSGATLSPPPSTLTLGERRLVSVVLVEPRPEPSTTGSALERATLRVVRGEPTPALAPAVGPWPSLASPRPVRDPALLVGASGAGVVTVTTKGDDEHGPERGTEHDRERGPEHDREHGLEHDGATLRSAPPSTLEGSAELDALLVRLASAAIGCEARFERLGSGALLGAYLGAVSAADQVAHAARAALALRRALPGARVVVTTGRGHVGARLPAGEAIDRAVSLLRSEAAGEGAVLVDEGTAAFLGGRFRVQREGALSLVEELPPRDPLRSVCGRPTPFVGRDRELTLLRDTFAEVALEPVARAVLVLGAPGMGKSRLAAELLERLAELPEPPELWSGRGDPMRASVPFGLAASVVRSAFALEDTMSPAERRERIEAGVGRLAGPDSRRVASFLAELVGAAQSDDSLELRAARGDPVIMGDQIRRSVEDLVGAAARRRPVVVTLDDLQWADLPTMRLVESTLRHLRDGPFFVLGLARPELDQRFPGLWNERGASVVRLAELGKRASRELARRVLGEGPRPQAPRATHGAHAPHAPHEESGPEAHVERLVERLVEQAEGNPFCLEELLRAELEERDEGPPPTVLATVEKRIESLSPAERRVLRAASVFGPTFAAGGVEALLGDDSIDVETSLARLCERELVLPRAPLFAGQASFCFRHGLVREAAYHMLTDDDRRLGHLLAADWLAGTGERDPALLAEHFERGGAPERAAHLYLPAAEAALGGNDFARTLELVERGLACQPSPTRRALLLLVGAEARRWRGEHGLAAEQAEEALSLVTPSVPLFFQAAGELALTAGRIGKTERLLALSWVLSTAPAPEPGPEPAREPALAEARAVPSERAFLTSLARVALMLLFAGENAAAERLALRVEQHVAEHAPRDPLALAAVHRLRANRANAKGDVGAYASELAAATLAFERAGDLRNACNASATAAHASMELGAYDDAVAALGRALELSSRLGLPTVNALAKHNLGLALARTGKVAEGRALEQEALALLEAQGDQRLAAGARIYLAMIEGLGGRHEAARRALDPALETLAGLPGLLAYALAVRARLHLEAGRAREALDDARAGMRILDQLGGLEEGESLLRLVHVEALVATGERALAREALAEAEARVSARAARIEDPAARESFVTRVPENARIVEAAAAARAER